MAAAVRTDSTRVVIDSLVDSPRSIISRHESLRSDTRSNTRPRPRPRPQPPAPRLSCYNRIKECCKLRFLERDWSGSFFKLRLFTLAISVLGISYAIDYFNFYDDHLLWDEPLRQWLYLLSASIAAIWIGLVADHIFFILVDLILFSNKTIQLFYYLYAAQQSLGLLVAAIFFELHYDKIIKKEHLNVERSARFAIYLLIGSIAHNLIIKISLRNTLITRFSDRIDEILVLKNTLLKMSSRRYEEVTRIFPESYHHLNWKLAIAKDRGFDIWLSQHRRVEVHRSSRMAVLGEQIWRQIEEYCPVSEGTIETDELLRWCGIDNEDPYYRFVFNSFDLNQDNYTSRDDFRMALSNIFQGWKQLKVSFSGQHSVSKAISIFSGVLFWFVSLVVFLNLFEIPTDTVFVPALTMTVSLSFAIGGILTKFVSSLVFVTIMHPYDVGDRIKSPELYDNATLVVKEISILNTVVVQTATGRITYIPNHLLMDIPIDNLAQSRNATLVLPFMIGGLTNAVKLENLQAQTKRYLLGNSIEWKPHISLFIEDSDPAAGKMKITFWVYHKADWMQTGRIWEARSKLIHHITQLMIQLEIEYTEFELPITLTNKKED